MSKRPMSKAATNTKFEEDLGRLETLVGKMEKGDLALEESLQIFEEGVRLSKSCLKMLEEAERKVEILMQDKEGKKRPRPFQLDEESLDEESGGKLRVFKD